MVKNIIMLVAIVLFLMPAALATAPVWTPISDQPVVAGNTLTFDVSASDADGDILTLDILSPDFSEVIFTSNISGSGTFTWPTTISRVGVHDFIFSASTIGANATQEETLETARITVTAAAVLPSLSPEEQEYNRVVDEFNTLEDDYSISKRRYERAVDDEDERDIDDYAEELEGTDDDLADLEEDVEDLVNDVEDSDVDNRRELLDNLEDLQDDIERVRDRIDTLLHDDEETAGTTTIDSYTPPPRVEPQPERTRVIVGSLDFPGGNMVNTVEQPDTWQDTRKMVLIGAGIIVLIAVIVFLIALMIL